MTDYVEEIRRAIVRKWLADEERSIAWLARRAGYTREYLSHVLSGNFPFTDRLARTLQEQVGIDFSQTGEVSEEGNLEPADVAVEVGA